MNFGTSKDESFCFRGQRVALGILIPFWIDFAQGLRLGVLKSSTVLALETFLSLLFTWICPSKSFEFITSLQS